MVGGTQFRLDSIFVRLHVDDKGHERLEVQTLTGAPL